MRRLIPLVLFAACVVSCTDTTATESVGYAPVTGILVRSESAVGNLGCGPGTGQVFKYVAVLRGPTDLGIDAGADAGMATPDQVLGIGIYDCFSDGLFNELAVDALYAVELFGFGQAAWDQSNGQVFALASNPGTAPAASAKLLALNPASTTTCTAVQRTGIQTVASCPAPQRVRP